jgi:hypothetical protein
MMLPPPNNAMHTDSEATLGFQVEHHWRGAGDGERYCDTRLCAQMRRHE